MILDPTKSMDFYIDYAKKHCIIHILNVSDDDTLETIQVITGNVKKEKISEILV